MQGQTAAEASVDAAPTSVALSILDTFMHVVDVLELAVPRIAPCATDSDAPPKFKAGQLLPLLRAHCHTKNLCALGAYLNARMLHLEANVWEDGTMVPEEIVVAAVLLQRALVSLDECTTAEVAKQYATVKLSMPFATLIEWANSFRVFNVQCHEAIFRRAVIRLAFIGP